MKFKKPCSLFMNVPYRTYNLHTILIGKVTFPLGTYATSITLILSDSPRYVPYLLRFISAKIDFVFIETSTSRQP